MLVIPNGGRRNDRSEGSASVFCVTAEPILHGYDAAMHEGSYFTYIMASRSRTLYIGVTRDLLRRVFEHKWKEHEGFTARYNCDRLVWFERFQWVQSAIAREKALKGWSRPITEEHWIAEMFEKQLQILHFGRCGGLRSG